MKSEFLLIPTGKEGITKALVRKSLITDVEPCGSGSKVYFLEYETKKSFYNCPLSPSEIYELL